MPLYFAWLPHWFGIVALVVDLLIRILALCWVPYNRKPSVALGWLMAIFLLPYVGLLAFLVIGATQLPKKRRDRQRSMTEVLRKETKDEAVVGDASHLSEKDIIAAQLNYELGALPLAGGNSFELLPDNNANLQTMAEQIDRAQDYVHFEFYIVGWDETSAPLLDSLFRAHERGVTVRILIDQLGSSGIPRWRELVRRLDSSGISWHRSLPIQPLKGNFQRPDLRNHRKILVIDGEVAFSGSQNAIDRSYDKPSNLRKNLQWKDLSMRIHGPLVRELNAVFLSDWYAETGEMLRQEAKDSLGGSDGGAMAQVVPSGPGFQTENNLLLINQLIHNAEHRVTICTPYFIPDSSLTNALITAARSGIEVTLIVCQKGNEFFAQYAQNSYYEQLLENQVRIMEYPAPTVLHTKFVLVDEDVAFIGSSNMDLRSFGLNLECTMFIVDREVVGRIYDVAEGYLQDCQAVDQEQWKKRPRSRMALENVCRLTSGLL